MYIKVAEMKRAARQVSEIYKVSIDDASKMIGYYNNHDRRVIQDILDGHIFDDDWKIAAKQYNIQLTIDKPEKVTGEIITPVSESDVLPPDIVNGIADTIAEFCSMHNIENMEKCRAQKWSVCCKYIGTHYIKPSGITRKGIKGNRYNMDVLDALLDVYLDFAKYYIKPILDTDYGAFCGIGLFTIQDHMERCDELTARYTQIYKKLVSSKDRDFEARLTEGRQNPTGVIFAAKNKAGWTDEKQVTQISVAAAPGAVALPRFGSVGIESK